MPLAADGAQHDIELGQIFGFASGALFRGIPRIGVRAACGAIESQQSVHVIQSILFEKVDHQMAQLVRRQRGQWILSRRASVIH